MTERATHGTRLLIKAAMFACLMPYIGLTFLPSDTQPFAFLLCALGFFLLVLESRFALPYVSFPAWAMAAIGALSLVTRVLFDGVPPGGLVRAYFGYITAPIVLTFFVNSLRFLEKREIARVVDLALWVTFIGFVLNVIGLSELVQLFVNRGIYDVASRARGLTSFFPEQSRVSEQMGIFFFVYLLTGTLSRWRVTSLVVACLLSAAGQMFIMFAEAGLAYVLAVALFGLMHSTMAARLLKHVWKLAIAAALFFIFREPLTTVLIRAGFPTRGITAIGQLSTVGLTYVGQDHGVMLKISGVLQAAATLADNPTNVALNASNDTDYPATISYAYRRIVDGLFHTTYLVYPKRPYSALGTWIIDFGLFGLLAVVALLALLFRISVVAPREWQQRMLWATLFLSEIFFIKLPLVNPSLWLLAAVIWRTGQQMPHAVHATAPQTRPDTPGALAPAT